MFLLFVIFLFHFVIGQLIEVFKIKPLAIIMAVLLLAIVYYFTLGLEYTADYGMYEFVFNNNFDTDYLFMRLTELSDYYHYTFHDLFALHIFVYTLIYFFFIGKFNNNIFYIFLAYIVLDYVHFSNQIRYYLGFPLMLWAFYHLYNKKYILCIICCLIAYLSHSATIVLITFVPMYLFLKTEFFLKYILISSAICFIIVYLAFSLGLGRDIEHFGEYFAESGVSGIFGGLFNAMPYLIFISFLYFQTKIYIRNNPECYTDKHFVFLYKLTFYSLVFIPASFFLQIIGHRYVMPFVVIYGIYFLYLIRNDKPKIKSRKLLGYSSICFTISLFIYILPTYILKENHFLHEVDLMLKSIEYLNYKEW